MPDYDVIVIGAGLGGISAGALLANKGRKTLVLDQSPWVGGYCSTFEKDGYQFDTGASLIEFPSVIDECFKRLGTSLYKEVELVALDPVYTVPQPDGTVIKHPASPEGMAEEIGKLAPEDVAGWREFSKLMEGFVGAALDGFFLAPANTFADMAKLFARTPAILKYMPLFVKSYQEILCKYFKSERVRDMLSPQAFFMALPPELCPAIYAMLIWGERMGLSYSKGGMAAIPNAICRLGQVKGMEVRLKTLVKKVLIRNGRAYGVKLEDGTEITSGIVVSNVNVKTLYQKLVGEEHLPWLTRYGLNSYSYTPPAAVLYLGVDYTPPLLSHHTFFPIAMEEYNRYYWDYQMKGRYPEKPFGMISWTTRTDPSLAPAGKNILQVTIEGPYKLEGATWDAVTPKLTEQYINYLSDNYVPGLKDHVDVAFYANPLEYERRFLAPEGTLFALHHDLANSAAFRVSSKSRCIKGLYLTGSSTHPGGGVPSCVASGVIAADLIEKYE